MTDVTGPEGLVVYQIGEVAERLGMSQRTIRHYDDLGIVKPSARTAGGFRLYTEADIRRFQLIRPFRSLGIGLDTALSVLQAMDALELGEDPTARLIVTETLELIATRRSELKRTLSESVDTQTVLQQALSRTSTV